MNDQNGFTLLSMMLALSTLLVIISLIVSITQFMTHRFQPRLDTQKETQIFFTQTATEIHLSHSVSSSSDQQTLTLKKGTDFVSYSFESPGRIVRKVNGDGYEIVLQQVKKVTFQTNGEFVSIRVTDKADRAYYWDDFLYVKDDAGDSQQH
ncbi:competence type IV pilus minor pilin ComGF [Sporolactobacillus sp. STCC-11]|uniref:competence type IV pilus minor pilin ComGF n=1 Tax=Sporolactobacillus caesalpiniae TaxID=3230362 RepID=UPI003396267E